MAVGTDDPPGPYSVGGRRLSETTVPVSVGSHKDVIGPGIVYVTNAPRSSTYIIWWNSVNFTRAVARLPAFSAISNTDRSDSAFATAFADLIARPPNCSPATLLALRGVLKQIWQRVSEIRGT